VEEVLLVSVHDALENVPLPAGTCPNVTLPVGADFVPVPVSVTVALHAVASSAETGFGEHTTSVEIGRFAAVIVTDVAALPTCVVSPPPGVYIAPIVCGPALVGV
jgi:hypothetical protein